ncbi:uncharacterized protein LOC107031524 [Solanum pennellii]|uniref:Uncharacterized protein LOC107031524 n=1 Tax=Solanum pennellii TaxID=28526 RepID=A0ABM1VHX5_SOLPN|nr:uncharacterized protein LOC107031524 [Solanum pennellii]XP_015088421.1 uncharacterized protein LOC107031524 [Solanum pennellii]XP_027775342.1 uncharacterized protein LOC107031524 [Solanum pennellii]XP_027775343.1 uncharacterized protein LOC107031524 [Solanum pennellii]XP_027775344.1 uncharacterized protein LOC107031524 [Solanum pennellii]
MQEPTILSKISSGGYYGTQPAGMPYCMPSISGVAVPPAGGKIQLSNRCDMCKMKWKQQNNRLSFVLILKPSSCLPVLFCNGGVFISKGVSIVLVEPHRHGCVFIAKGKEDDLFTNNGYPVKLSTIKRESLFRKMPLIEFDE